MKNTEFIYFTLGALSLFAGILIKPTLDAVYKRVVLMLKRKPRKVVPNDFESRLIALETKVSKRESNQRTFIRQEVKEYLIKLQK